MDGVIATVLDSERTERNGAPVLDVKSDPGGGANYTPEHFAPAGDDSRPLPGDSLGGIPVQGTGRGIVSGYADPKNVGIAKPGEVRRYSRDVKGDLQAQVYIRDDGSVEIESIAGSSSVVLDPGGGFTVTSPGATLKVGALGDFSVSNMNGNITMALSGDVDINGLTISADGEITNAAGVVLGTHGHLPGTLMDSVPLPVTGIAGLPT